MTYVIPTLGVGGAETQLATLAAQLDRAVFQPLIVSLVEHAPLQDMLAPAGVEVVTLGLWEAKPDQLLRRVVGKLLLPSFLWRFGRILRRERPDIIHAFLPTAAVYAAIAKCLFARDAKLIVSKRSLGTYKADRRLLALAERWANRVADVILVNSRAVRDDVLEKEKASSSKIHLVYNGVDLSRFLEGMDRDSKRLALGFQPGDKLVGVVANLHPYKGHATIIEASASVLRMVPAAKFVFVGRDAGSREDLQRLAEARGVRDAVVFLGQRGDVPELLQMFDVQVLASNEEGFSNAILEGMAAGTPLVVTDVGGNSEAVVNEETGLVIPPREPGPLAEAIVELLTDHEKARRLSMAGRARVEELFTTTGMVQCMEKLYQQLCQ